MEAFTIGYQSLPSSPLFIIAIQLFTPAYLRCKKQFASSPWIDYQ